MVNEFGVFMLLMFLIIVKNAPLRALFCLIDVDYG
jgi:hypothetical protein